MRLAVFSAKPYDKAFLSATHAARDAARDAALPPVTITYYDFSLNPDTVDLVRDTDAVCVFVNDVLTAPVLQYLSHAGVRAVLLRCAGYNNVDLLAAEHLGLAVANVPSYSPEAVAEYAVALIQTLNRRTHRAYNRVREGNFALDGLLGRTLSGKTVGLIGTGRIGLAFARIMKGFGCTLYAYDPFPSREFEGLGEYISLEELLPRCDFISLHCPLMDETKHIICDETLAQLKPGAFLVNTSRGGLVDTTAVISALKERRLAGLALDVYEGEGKLFYDDHSGEIIQDDELARLMLFPNVLVSGHQAFFTEEALREIAECTLRNLDDVALGRRCPNSLVRDQRIMVRRDSMPVRNV